ncbi:MAG: hypothetical protein EBU01_11060 [Crocinitomicaceae bacterium]|nr:hypothetical protein [Crocinitomicaceae bacterium]
MSFIRVFYALINEKERFIFKANVNFLISEFSSEIICFELSQEAFNFKFFYSVNSPSKSY